MYKGERRGSKELKRWSKKRGEIKTNLERTGETETDIQADRREESKSVGIGPLVQKHEGHSPNIHVDVVYHVKHVRDFKMNRHNSIMKIWLLLGFLKTKNPKICRQY